MPILPQARWLPEAIDSLCAQSYSQWSLVAVLDGSCAQNRETLERARLGGRLTVIQLPSGTGVAGALNAGLRSTDAEYVARLDADDTCVPERLSVQISAIVQLPEVWVLGSSACNIDESGRVIGLRHVALSSDDLRRILLWRNAMIHPSVLMRREKILDIGGYNVASRRMEDYELWLRVAAHAELRNLAEPLTHYRVHAGQHSRGPRLGDARAIRHARRALTHGPLSRVAADARHIVWLAAQHHRDGH